MITPWMQSLPTKASHTDKTDCSLLQSKRPSTDKSSAAFLPAWSSIQLSEQQKKYGDSSDKNAINGRSEFGVFAHPYPQLFQDNNKLKNHFIIHFIIK